MRPTEDLFNNPHAAETNDYINDRSIDGRKIKSLLGLLSLLLIERILDKILWGNEGLHYCETILWSRHKVLRHEYYDIPEPGSSILQYCDINSPWAYAVDPER